VQGAEQPEQGTRGEGSAVVGSAAEVRGSLRREVRAASAGINSVIREAREGRVEVRPTTPRTNIEAFQDIKSYSFCPSPW
jgi:hypothetical protein